MYLFICLFFKMRSLLFVWQPANVCLPRSTSKSTDPINGRFCTVRQCDASAAVSHRLSCNQSALLCTAGWRRWKRDSAEQHGEDGARTWWRLLLSSVFCYTSLVPFAGGKGDADACDCEPGVERWRAWVWGTARLTLTCLKPCPPEMKEPLVTALKIVSDGGRIPALSSLSSTKQDDCYCGTFFAVPATKHLTLV